MSTPHRCSLRTPSAWLRRAGLCTAMSVGAALATHGCKKDDTDKPAETPAAEPGQAEGSEPAAGGTQAPPKLSQTVQDTIADAMDPATELQRGGMLAHILMPNPIGFLGEIRTQAAPPAFGMFLQEEMLRNLMAGQLGSRAGIGQHVALDQPFGCVLADSGVTKVPFACTLGYQGGAKALLTDLGEEGKQADASGHVGHYQLEGEDVYIDELGEMVVVSNHPEVFGLSKSYIETNLIGRAPELINDIELVAFVGPAMDRYKEELEPLLGMVAEMPVPEDDNPFVQAMAAYSKQANLDSMQRYRDTEQATVGLSLEKAGLVMRWAWFPKPGSSYATEMAAFAGGPLDLDFAAKLPASTWFAAGYRFDDRVEKVQSLEELREIFVDAYAKSTGKNPDDVTSAIDTFYKESVDLYGPDVAMGVAHLPGTYGGMVVEIPLEAGKSGRERWKALATVLTPENVLPPEAKEMVTWTWSPDAAEIAGHAVDRLVIEPTDKGRKELEKGGEQAAEWGKKLDGFKLAIDRVEVNGRTILAISTPDATPYTTAAIDAVGGKGSLTDVPGFQTISDRVRGKGLSTFAALDVQGAADWAKTLVPPEDAAQFPPKLGNDLSDFMMFAAYSKSGKAWTGEFVFSQPLIDTLKALAN